ncbi:hypothetical protein SANTM175S_10655 [Streptomyces antimycoticus]
MSRPSPGPRAPLRPPTPPPCAVRAIHGPGRRRRSEGKTILVDTGVGNHKHRPYAPVWSYLNTDFLGNLARAGVRPEDVDIVINTHLHVDHVGWNTRLDGRQWVPTFPNATYILPERDFEFWNPENGHKSLLGRGNQNVFEDSRRPRPSSGQGAAVGGRSRHRRQSATGTRPADTPRARPCSLSIPEAIARSSWGTCCTARCRSRIPTPTAASARTRPNPVPPAAGSSAGRPRRTPWSSPHTWAVMAPRRCGATATGSPSRNGRPSRAS